MGLQITVLLSDIIYVDILQKTVPVFDSFGNSPLILSFFIVSIVMLTVCLLGMSLIYLKWFIWYGPPWDMIHIIAMVLNGSILSLNSYTFYLSLLVVWSKKLFSIWSSFQSRTCQGWFSFDWGKPSFKWLKDQMKITEKVFYENGMWIVGYWCSTKY